MFSLTAICALFFSNISGKLLLTTPNMIISDIIHIINWVKPISATPTILPIINCMGLTDETMISTMRLVFSSNTLRNTIEQYIKIKR